jgi:hypothetical protein
MSVTQLTLKITDPEDGAFFINKVLTRIHGYLRQQQKDSIGLNFNSQHIYVYAQNKAELDALLANDAIKFDIERQIFSVAWEEINGQIKLCQRVRPLSDVAISRKIRRKIEYLSAKFSLDKIAAEQKRRELVTYYKTKKDAAFERYFLIKQKDKRFTVWVKTVSVDNADFAGQCFNSYGLIK